MDPATMMSKVIGETNRVVDGIDPSQLGNPSPCSEWTVRDVLNHVTGGSKMFAVYIAIFDVATHTWDLAVAARVLASVTPPLARVSDAKTVGEAGSTFLAHGRLARLADVMIRAADGIPAARQVGLPRVRERGPARLPAHARRRASSVGLVTRS